MKRNDMPILNSKQIESLTKTIPIYTKEQKIIQKALNKINYYINFSTNKKELTDLYYACGLLESLLFFNDDKESSNANHHP